MPTTIFHMIAGAPQPVAPYSHAVESGDWVFVTGQLPNDPQDDLAPLPEGIEAQTRRVLDNLTLVLGGLGLGLDAVVSVRVFLTHFREDYAAMNMVYASYFPSDRRPARTCIGVTDVARDAPDRDRLHRSTRLNGCETCELSPSPRLLPAHHE